LRKQLKREDSKP